MTCPTCDQDVQFVPCWAGDWYACPACGALAGERELDVLDVKNPEN